MKQDPAFEALLSEALGRKGAPAPFPVDVADLVMARIAVLGVSPRTETSLRQLGWWAAAAAVAGVALTLAWPSGRPPTSRPSPPATCARWPTRTGAALKLAAPAGSLAGTLGRVAVAVVSSAQTLVQPLAPLQPLARVLLAAVAAGMLSFTTFVVGRDMRTRVAGKERA